MNRKILSYTSVIIFSIIITILLLIIFINPYSLKKEDFNQDFNFTEQNYIKLSDPKDIVNYVETRTNFMDKDAFDLRKRGQLSENQVSDIVELSSSARRELDSYKSGNENELWWALFNTQLAISYKTTYPFINCAEEVYQISKEYKPLFFYLGKADRDRVLKLYDIKNRLTNLLDDHERYRENNETLINLAQNAERIEQDFDLYKLKCDEFRSYIKEDYKRQKNWFFFKLSAIILISIFSVILGIVLSNRNRKRINRSLTSFGHGLNEVWSPREVKDKTIVSIIKINSVTTTLVAFLGSALAISGFNNWIVVSLIILSVLSLLSSILLGVISLNNERLSFKKACYRLFIFGLFLFIFFFLYLIFFGGIITIIQGMAESVKSYLNNQTVIK